MDFLAASFVNHTAGMPADKDGFIGVWVAMKEMFPAGKYTVDNILGDGDQVVVFGRFEGAHTGAPFEGIKAAGAKVNLPFALLFNVKDGQITDRWAIADDVMGLLVPLGFKVTPPEQ